MFLTSCYMYVSFLRMCFVFMTRNCRIEILVDLSLGSKWLALGAADAYE